MARINFTIDDETLETLDSMANANGMSRSECIRFMVEAMDELNAWSALQSVGARVYAEKFGREPEADRVSPSMMLRAASRCSVVMD